MAETGCRFFNGYKPCTLSTQCTSLCHAYDPVDQAMLIIHLGAMGSVVRSTALLRKIKKQNPRSYIVWLTEKPNHQLLQNHPAIDRVFEFNFESVLSLKAFQFETVYALDKEIKIAGLLPMLNYRQLKGFTVNPVNGGITPADADADELWSLGLSNQKKFFENKKSEIQLLFETCGMDFNQEKYWLHLTESERLVVSQRRSQWLGLRSKTFLIGINTGCGNVISYKKMSLESQVLLISKIKNYLPQAQVVLLGGKDETTMNSEIAAQQQQVIQSETSKGLRDGLQSIAAVDCLISGDSFAMHAGIAFDKFTLAWFGPTCAHEVDFYGNGAAIKSDFPCSPCWKRDCSKQVMCYEYPYIDGFIDQLLKFKINKEIPLELNAGP